MHSGTGVQMFLQALRHWRLCISCMYLWICSCSVLSTPAERQPHLRKPSTLLPEFALKTRMLVITTFWTFLSLLCFCIRLLTGCTFPLMWLYPDLTIHIFCTNHLHELTHTCTHSYLALLQNGICYRIMLFPPLHLLPLNTIFLCLPCNRVHSFLAIATCVSLLH